MKMGRLGHTRVNQAKLARVGWRKDFETSGLRIKALYDELGARKAHHSAMNRRKN
jgi:hypothetical protein